MRLSSEAKVGLVVLAGVLILTYMTFTISGFRFGREPGYRIYAVFDTVAGLDDKSQVRLAGVSIGRVETIALTDSKAKVTLRINPEVTLQRGSRALVKALGLLGEKYVEVQPGTEAVTLAEGDTIEQSGRGADLDRLIDQASGVAEDLKAVTASLRNALGTAQGEQSLTEIVANVRELSRNLNETVKSNRDNFTKTVANFEAFSRGLKQDGPEVMASLKRALAQVEEIGKKLDTVAARLERGEGTIGKLLKNEDVYTKLDSALGNLDAITKKVERGEGTIGKLFSDEKAYEQLTTTLEGIGGAVSRIQRFKTIVGLRSEYQTHTGENKGYFSVTLQPRDDKFYTLELVDDPRGQVRRTTTQIDGNAPVATLETRRRLKITALFGKRYADLILRAGLVENSFGAGADVLFFKDTLRFSIDAWAFNNDDPLSDRAHLKATGSYSLFRHLFVQGGYDNFLNKKSDTFFVGGGLRIEDDDLKYLLGSAPIKF